MINVISVIEDMVTTSFLSSKIWETLGKRKRSPTDSASEREMAELEFLLSQSINYSGIFNLMIDDTSWNNTTFQSYCQFCIFLTEAGINSRWCGQIHSVAFLSIHIFQEGFIESFSGLHSFSFQFLLQKFWIEVFVWLIGINFPTQGYFTYMKIFHFTLSLPNDHEKPGRNLVKPPPRLPKPYRATHSYTRWSTDGLNPLNWIEM